MPEMVVFFDVLCSAATKIGLLTAKPRQDVLKKVVEANFRAADVNNDAALSCKEFVAWARKNVLSRALLNSFRTVRKRTVKRAKATGRGGRATSLRRRDDNSKQQQQRRRNTTRLQALNTSLVAVQEVLSSLDAETAFGPEQVKRLRTCFTNRAGDRSGALNRKQFVGKAGSLHTPRAECESVHW